MQVKHKEEALRVELPARLLESLGQAVGAVDLSGRITYWNHAAEELLGWSLQDIRGLSVIELAVPLFGTERASEILAALFADQPWSGPFTVRRKDGMTFTAIVTGSAVHDAHGEIVGAVGVVTDLGQLLRPFLSQSHEAAVVTDADGLIQFASPAVTHVLGWPEEAMAGLSLYAFVHDDDRPLVEQHVRASLSAGAGDRPVEFRFQNGEHEWLWVEAVIADLIAEPSVRGLVWTFRDISERRAHLDRMTDVALHDPLTGLANRFLLADRLTQATARRQPHGVVLFIDLDDFKQVNDELGHAAGDALLTVIAQRLAAAMRPEDSCGRWAGDEFLVINESIDDATEAQALAHRIEQVIAEPVTIAGRRWEQRASIGIAMFDGTHDADRLLRRADEAMYRIKTTRGHR